MEKLPFRVEKDKRRWSALSIMQSITKRKTAFFMPIQTMKTATPAKKSFFPSKEVIRREKKTDCFVFNPTSMIKVLWDGMISIQAIYLALIIPFSLSFMQKIDRDMMSPIEICFMFDLFLNFNTACYIHGILVVDRKRIFFHYLSSYFLWDFISIVPYELFLSDMNEEAGHGYSLNYWHWSRIFWLFRLTRMLKLKKLIYNIDDIYPSPYVYFITRATAFLLLALLSAHWIACIMHSVWYYSLSSNGDMWTHYIDAKYPQYLIRLEEAVVTMATVGYGNITPQSISEKIFTIIVEAFTSGFIGFLVSGIGSTLEKSTKDSIYFNNLKQRLKTYMHNHQIPHTLRRKVFIYLEHLYLYHKRNILDEKEILKALSEPLQRDIYIHTRGHVLMRSVPFRDYSYTFLKYLGQKLEVELFSPCDSIFKQGQKNTNIYLVRHGRVEIYHQATGTIFAQLHEEKYFGEIAFFLGRKRCASARCLDFSEIFSLSRETFKRFLIKFPKEAEMTQIIVNNCKGKNLSYLGVRCYFCHEVGHVASDCEKYVYKIDHEEIINRANYSKNALKRTITENAIFQKKHEISPFSRYGLHNIQGDEISPLNLFKDRNSLAFKARAYGGRKVHGEKARKTIITLLDDDMNDISEDRDYYLNVPNNIRFGEMYAQRRKTQACPVHLTPSEEFLEGEESAEVRDTNEASSYREREFLL
ncbi:unnamed protein product [Blepharisma stoltei]|uniref:Cyclic nucleotide-binding domain-containing protein n=1 Tax=Blepharisma stoltei TaxID=1481888 RepID=A0AAU9JBY4_9CILI|nr:unnamed protein product [Blepharisma stoltei]